MKKAKKMALQAMGCAAFAAAMVLAGCDDGGVGSDIIEVSGYDAKSTVKMIRREIFTVTCRQ